MKKTKHILSLVLCFAMVLSCFAGMSVNTVFAAGNSKYSTEEVILHCWNWPISTIKAKLNDIKEAGYTAIQTSPINGIVGSGSSSADNTVDNWYQFYQPKNYTIGNKICSENEFKSFCTEAHELGLKVIVDVVLNHTTDQTTQVSGIQQDYHGNGAISNWDDRWQQTQKDITGMPDLNTANTTLQSQARRLLENILAAGADGFRYDAAKHIELPSGEELNSGCPTSSYWPNVTNSLGDKFSYGEVLAGQNCPLANYSKYMNVTGSAYSDTVQNCARNMNFPANDLTDYKAGLGGNNLVCWAESHDNYKGGNYGMPNSQIKLAWAAVTAQNLNAAYMARPYGSTTSNWQGSNKTTDGGDDFYFDKEVVAVNKFHNAAKGKAVSLENVGGNTQVLAVKRENAGVCIINASSSSKSISVGTSMPNGTYTDAANGGTFYVNNGTLTGTVSAKSVAAVFKADSSSPTSSTSATNAPAGKYTVKFTNNKGWSNVYLYAWGSSGSNASWPGVQLTNGVANEFGEQQFTANIDDKYTSIIFSNGSEQTVDIPNTTRDGSITGYYLTEKTNNKWNVGTWQEQAASTAAPTTVKPTTAPPTTTEAPTTVKPTTEPPEPTTEAPTTAKPTTVPEPTTEAPTTAKPTTEPPEPTTEAPTTAKPTTEPPEPTTEAPTTAKPTTVPEPTTTAAPTTAKPTTAPPTVPSGKYTVMFSNNKSWSKVYLYAWMETDGNTKNAAWPGVQLTNSTTNTYGEQQFTAEIDDKFDKIIFNDGNGEQTIDIANIARDGSITGYYLTDKTDGKWNIGTWQEQAASTAAPTQAPTTVKPTTVPEPTTTAAPEPTTVAPEKKEYTVNVKTNGIAAFAGGDIYIHGFNTALDTPTSGDESFVMTSTGANLYTATFKTSCKYFAIACYAGDDNGISVDLAFKDGNNDYTILNETTTDAAGMKRYKVAEGITTDPSDPEPTTEAPTTAKPTTVPEPTTTAAPTTAKPTTAPPTVPSGKYTVMFSNNKSWSKVYLYAWMETDGNTKNADWPGVQLTNSTTNTYGEQQFTAEIDDKFDKIIFNDGNGEQTIDIANIARDGSITGYYLTDKTNNKWNVGTWQEQAASTAAPTQAPTTVKPTEAPTTEAPEPTTTVAPETTVPQPTVAPNIYTDKNGEEINLNESVSKEADDNQLTGIGTEFKNLQILGVQKKNENKRSIRFVTVINNKVLQDAADYGYIAVGAADMATARSVVESYTLDKNPPEKHIFSCKGTGNKISGKYGDKDADTKYKYVTYTVDNIGEYAVGVMFYVKDKNGNVFYAPYTNANGTFDSCVANWKALSD